MITVQEKLDEVEALIEDFRWARNDTGVREYSTHRALKAIAADLRARLDGAPQVTETDLGRLLTAIDVNGATAERLSNLGYQVRARWPVIKQALEVFGRGKPTEEELARVLWRDLATLSDQYQGVPFDEVLRRPRYQFLRDLLLEAAGAVLGALAAPPTRKPDPEPAACPGASASPQGASQ